MNELYGWVESCGRIGAIHNLLNGCSLRRIQRLDGLGSQTIAVSQFSAILLVVFSSEYIFEERWGDEADKMFDCQYSWHQWNLYEQKIAHFVL